MDKHTLFNTALNEIIPSLPEEFYISQSQSYLNENEMIYVRHKNYKHIYVINFKITINDKLQTLFTSKYLDLCDVCLSNRQDYKNIVIMIIEFVDIHIPICNTIHYNFNAYHLTFVEIYIKTKNKMSVIIDILENVVKIYDCIEFTKKLILVHKFNNIDELLDCHELQCYKKNNNCCNLTNFIT